MNDPDFVDNFLLSDETLTNMLTDEEFRVLLQLIETVEMYVEVIAAVVVLFIFLVVVCLRRTFFSSRARQNADARRQ